MEKIAVGGRKREREREREREERGREREREKIASILGRRLGTIR